MNKKLAIETSTTPGESMFSNAVVERNNKVLHEALVKTMENAKSNMEAVLAWQLKNALMQKNTLQTHGRYSPNQSVFSPNVNLPSVITDLVPALEFFSSSDIVKQNLNALHDARTNFMRPESSERVK